MITVDIIGILRAVGKAVLFFLMYFISYGFAKVTLNKDSKTWERVLGIVEIILFIVFALLMFY